jgi:hypothetical protein
MNVTIEMTAQDAEQLTTTSMAWGNDWAEQDGRFENVKTDGATPSYAWAKVFWLEQGAASMILFTSFLKSQGEGFEVLWDLAQDGAYVVLTNWTNE